MRKKISNFRFEKFVFFLFLFALALISAKSAAAQTIMSNSSNILEIKASSTLTNSVLKFVPSTSANSFSLQAIANPVVGASTVSIFDYLSSTSLFKMLNGTLNYNPSNNRIGIGMTDPGYKFDVSGTGRFTAKLMLDAAEGLGVYGIRGRTSNEQVEMYQKVSIGSPNGWGTFPQAPGGGLSVYGGANFATNNGNVGIGTTTPAAKLSVSGGNIFITDAVINSGTPHAAITKTYLDSALGAINGYQFFHSGSDFANGTLVSTNIPASASEGNSFVIEISGKTYSSSNPPFKVIAQGYLYGGTIISYSGVSYGGEFAPYIKMFEDGGYLKFWWPRISYWNSFNVHVRNADGNAINRVTSISDSTEPTGTKKIQVNLHRTWNSYNSNLLTADWRANNLYTNGSVGIGTTAPGTYKLNVTGTTYLGGATTINGAATIGSIATVNSGIELGTSGTRSVSYYGPIANGYFTQMQTTGTAGFGTYGPVSGDWALYNRFSGASSRGWLWQFGTTNVAGLNGQGHMQIAGNFNSQGTGNNYFAGSVGVGTTTPEVTLDVNGLIKMRASNITTTSDVVNKGYLDSALETLSSDLSASTTASNYWAANGANIYNKNTAGNVGIGTSLPGQQLQITKSFELPDTVGATPYGVIYKGGDRFIHNFNYGLNGNGVTTDGRNTFVGEAAGNFTMGATATTSNQSSYNTGVGHAVLYNNTTGFWNSALGYNALIFNTTGFANSAVGYYSLNANTTGSHNSAIGYYSLFDNKTGNNNSAIGANALDHNTTGSANSAIGALALYYHTTGNSNSAVGVNAGRYLANGTSFKYSGDMGLYLGYNSKAGADGATNEIVIGAEAIGGGSNTVTLGNDSITTTRLKGKVGVGVSPAYKLDVAYDGSGVNLTGNTIHNLGAPATGTDAVNRNYVDSVIPAQLWAANGNNINNTNTGNVGIGNPTPGTKLDVTGAIRTNNQLISTLANGTAPLAVTSATVVTNLNADLLDGQTGSYYDQRVYNSASNYLGGGYNGGGSEKPNWAGFGAGKLKLQMLSGSNVGAPDSWNDVLWISGYTGGDVKGSNALIFSKYNDHVGFVRQDFDSATWGTYREFYHTGNSNLLTVDWKASRVGVGVSPAYKLDVAYDGSGVNLTGNTIHNLGAPATGTDAVNRNYVDSVIPVIPAQLWTANGNNIFNNNTGNVGIGVNTPLAKLQINNEAAFNTLTPGPAAYYGLHFGGQTTADYATGITWSGGTSGTQAGIYVQGSGSYGSRMYFATTNSYATGAQNRMIINEGGNVGIGTTAPGAYKLYVNGATYTSGNLNTGGNLTVAGDAIISGSDVYDNSGDLHLSGEDSLYFKMDYNNDDADTRNIIFAKNTALGTVPTGVNELMRITETGNVSIGDIIPAYKLDVKGEGNFGNSQVHGVSAPSSDTDAANQGYVKSSVEGFAFWKLAGSNLYASSTTWNVGIGNNAPAQKLDVTGSINSSAGYKVNNSAVSGNYLRGNGSNFVASTIQAGDVPTLNQNTSGYAGYLMYEDNRSISPSELARNMMKFGFTSYKNNNSAPWADFLHFRSYGDSSAGNDNLLVFNKTALGMRLYQEVFGSASPYTKYKDVVLAENTPAANYLTKYSTVGDEVTIAASSIYDNGTYVGIGTTTPTSKLHVVGSSYLNGTIKTALTGTGSRCLHVDSNGVIGTMAGDCGTSTGGDNLGNGIASTNIALGNYWLSGDGGNEGVFVKADGKVGIGDNNPAYKLTISGDVGINGSSNSILFNLHTGSASGRSYLNFQSDEAYGSHTYSIDSLYALTSNPTLSGAMLSLNPSGGGVSFGGSVVVPNAVYNADSSRWLSFGPSGDSLKVAGNLNTTAGTLKVSGTGNSWIMGKLGIGTTNPNSTAGMTIDTAATAPSILFRNAGSDKALISFRNGINFTMNSSIGAPVVPGNTGSYNIGIGSYTFYTGTGSSNIGIGVGAARSSSGNGNIAIGISAMDSTGAGSSNIAIGNSALYQGTSGAYNIAIGVNALNGSGIGDGNIAIGNRGQWTNSSNKLYIGDLNPGLTDLPLIYGDMTSTTTGAVGIKTTNLQSGMAMTVAGKVYADDFIYSSSDARLKHDIKNLSEIDYQKILKLRPVSFTYNKNNSKGFGFIAQELEKLYPEMVETNESDGMKSVTYDNLISPTIMAIQEQQKKIEEQETLIQILLDRVNKLENSTK